MYNGSPTDPTGNRVLQRSEDILNGHHKSRWLSFVLSSFDVRNIQAFLDKVNVLAALQYRWWPDNKNVMIIWLVFERNKDRY